MEKEEIRAKYGCCGDYDNCQHPCTSKGQYLEANRQREKRHKHYDNRLAAWEEVIPALRNDAKFCFAIGFDLGAASKTEWVGLTDAEIEDAIDDGFSSALDNGNVSTNTVIRYVRIIEAKLKGKNT